MDSPYIVSGARIKFHGSKGAPFGQATVTKLENSGLSADYQVENFFHPLITAIVDRLNRNPLKDALDPDALRSLERKFFEDNYDYHGKAGSTFSADYQFSTGLVSYTPFPSLEIDVGDSGPYANYNWELLVHIPVAIAIHLSKSQRFAESQRWFHLVFDPSDPNQEYWRSLALQGDGPRWQIDKLLRLLQADPQKLSPDEEAELVALQKGYLAIMRRPFRPFAVARTRPISFQLMVVMRYLDNLLAWGDSLFAQDTAETVSEATQIYVLGATLLGDKPQQVPTPSGTPGRSYNDLKKLGLDVTGNAMVQLESMFPFNYGIPQGAQTTANAAPLFGLVRTLYFCIPRNEKLLRYWDDFADRLGKIRSGMNLQGVIRRLALFDPPIDPALLVRAAASGVDIGAAVAGMNQPFVPVRAALLLQRAAELAAEVKSLGSAVLAAMERQDGEELALMRQGHELRMLAVQREIRLLQWKQAEEATEQLLRTRTTTLDRYKHSLRQLGMRADVPETLPKLRAKISEELNEERFNQLYEELVKTYDRSLPSFQFRPLNLAKGGSAETSSGAQGSGNLYLTRAEDHELQLMEAAAALQTASVVSNTIASVLTFIPDLAAKLAFWGIGADAKIFGGQKLAGALNLTSQALSGTSGILQSAAGMAGRGASYERRADDWMFQANQAGRELMQLGRQLIGAVIAEQSARREYENVCAQYEDSTEVNEFMQSKFTGLDLHHWMQGELSRLHRAYFDFAVYTARKAESAVKRELMRPEVESATYIGGDYWNAGRRGLLAGEALHLDLKRLEMAHLEGNKYEDVLTKRVSLRRLKPLALLDLQATGTCSFRVPEWLFDLDRPGHYMRRIRQVRLSMPAVVGPNSNAVARVKMSGGTIRRQTGGAKYLREGSEDLRFLDYTGSVEVTLPLNPSEAAEPPSARDQLLPFEGLGAVDTEWQITLPPMVADGTTPPKIRQFDYRTISDVTLEIQYTARSGGDKLAKDAATALDGLLKLAASSPAAVLISVPDEFPSEWGQFKSKSGSDLQFDITRDFLPYLADLRSFTVASVRPYAVDVASQAVVKGTALSPANSLTKISTDLNDSGKRKATITLPADAALVRNGKAHPYVVVEVSL